MTMDAKGLSHGCREGMTVGHPFSAVNPMTLYVIAQLLVESLTVALGVCR